MANQYSYTFKILLLGAGAVGKTSLVQRFVHGKFQKAYLMTIGMDPYSRYCEINGKQVCFSLWDIAGQDRFQTMRTMFFRGALGALIVFDLTREQTFTDLKKWLKDLKTSSPGALSILVGNKNDLEDMRVISREEAEKFAEENNCIGYMETSAKSGINVADAFNTIGERLLNRKLDELDPR